MASNIRNQLENWLSTIDVRGNVIDVGGLALPVDGRTLTWVVKNYQILDIKKSRKGRPADYIFDLNLPADVNFSFDVAFCLEVLYQMWDPATAIRNLNKFLVLGGKLYLSTHFMYPLHEGVDCSRMTAEGITKLLENCGFGDIYIEKRTSCVPDKLMEFSKAESKTHRLFNEVGHLIKAIKIKELWM